MILRNREITKFPEMEAIINEAEVCTVAMVHGNKPYVLPFNFAYWDSVVYLHCDTKGLKLKKEQPGLF